MTSSRLSLIFVLALLLASCVTVTPVTTKSVFDASEVAFIHNKGQNTISAQAFLRQQGGGIVTCAGEIIALIPSGKYSRERMRNIYGTTSRVARNIAIPDAPDPEYMDYARETTCDAQGNALFEDIPDGSYFVATTVRWIIGGVYQGGTVMAPVTVSGGKNKRLIIAP